MFKVANYQKRRAANDRRLERKLPTGYDYYRCDGSFDYVGLDDSDFEDYKSRVLDWMDDNILADVAVVFSAELNQLAPIGDAV